MEAALPLAQDCTVIYDREWEVKSAPFTEKLRWALRLTRVRLATRTCFDNQLCCQGGTVPYNAAPNDVPARCCCVLLGRINKPSWRASALRKQITPSALIEMGY